ncbi:hypothetical protein PSNIH1_01040 [Pantoea sp. PSNIH1]|nr:hypothetical protein PSNIH1_01040 [Pantoea sp. PSNIH1]
MALSSAGVVRWAARELCAEQRGGWALSSAGLGAKQRAAPEGFRPPGFWQFQRHFRTRTG